MILGQLCKDVHLQGNNVSAIIHVFLPTVKATNCTIFIHQLYAKSHIFDCRCKMLYSKHPIETLKLPNFLNKIIAWNKLKKIRCSTIGRKSDIALDGKISDRRNKLIHGSLPTLLPFSEMLANRSEEKKSKPTTTT